jgi:Cellulose biosynthesis protein BcsS
MFRVRGRSFGLFLSRPVMAGAVILVVLACDGGHRPGMAQEAAGQHTEISVGAAVSQQYWSVYSGATFAPFGALTEDGVRLRASGGYGAFHYSALRPSGGGGQLVKFRGTVSFGDLLVGYHQQLGALTLKLYAGAMATRHVIDPFDPEASVQGSDIGGKTVLETWWTLGEHAWASLDVSYGTLHDTYGGRLRFGWRLAQPLSTGIEVAADGNTDGDSGRVGAFVRYEWAQGEVSASGGLMTDWAGIEKIDARGAYATIAWMNRF